MSTLSDTPLRAPELECRRQWLDEGHGGQRAACEIGDELGFVAEVIAPRARPRGVPLEFREGRFLQHGVERDGLVDPTGERGVPAARVPLPRDAGLAQTIADGGKRLGREQMNRRGSRVS